MPYTPDDKAIAFRVYEVIEAGAAIEPGDTVFASLPPTPEMSARNESYHPAEYTVEPKHIEIAELLLKTPITNWRKAGLEV